MGARDGRRMGWRSRLLLGGLVLVVVAGAGLTYLTTLEGEYRRETSPDGRYVAIATFPLAEIAVPRFPGQSGDKSGYIRIVDTDGTDYGKIPVPMVSMLYDIRWEAQGAYLVATGEWDFAGRTYWYWTDDQGGKVTGTAK